MGTLLIILNVQETEVKHPARAWKDLKEVTQVTRWVQWSGVRAMVGAYTVGGASSEFWEGAPDLAGGLEEGF